MTNNRDGSALAGSSFWLLKDEPYAADRLSDVMGPPDGIAIVDQQAWDKSVYDLVGHRAWLGLEPRRIADMAPPLQLRLPNQPWETLDYFSVSSCRFASVRLREALLPWADLIDWVPLDITASEEMGRQADYRLMRLLAHRPAFDAVASGLVKKSPEQLIVFPERLVLRDDLTDAPPLFHAEDRLSTWLASDAVAERVMRAGCTGIEFLHPEDIRNLDRPRRVRGPGGIVLRSA